MTLKIFKSGPRLGKPYSQQPGRKAGKGRGKIKTDKIKILQGSKIKEISVYAPSKEDDLKAEGKIDRNSILDKFAKQIIREDGDFDISDFLNAGMTKKEALSEIQNIDISDYVDELLSYLKIKEEDKDEGMYIWGDKLDKKVKSLMRIELKDAFEYMKDNE